MLMMPVSAGANDQSNNIASISFIIIHSIYKRMNG